MTELEALRAVATSARIRVRHWFDCASYGYGECNCGLDDLAEALATLDAVQKEAAQPRKSIRDLAEKYGIKPPKVSERDVLEAARPKPGDCEHTNHETPWQWVCPTCNDPECG